MSKIARIWKYYFLRFKRLRGNPHILALGSAIGVFIGLTPTMPFHTALILIICLLTRGSFIAAVIVSWIVCNPLTYFPIYYFSILIGNWITPHELNSEDIYDFITVILSDHTDLSHIYDAFLSLGYEALMVLLIGGVIFALPSGFITYYLSFFFFRNMAKKQREKMILN